METSVMCFTVKEEIHDEQRDASAVADNELCP